jgi:acyl transferase domain-containing protein/acyl carrier protein
VFAGAAPSGYSGYGAGLEGAEGYLVTGNATSVISGRVSYVLGLEGPAVTVDTACSSALVALHLACQALRAGDCSLALAGGVAVMASPEEFVGFSRQRALAADGRCKAFGAGADGMGLAEGAGMVVVERLSDARRLGHRVLAVVAGTAVNQDGASNGLTAPNGPSQQRVIRAALASAGLAPDQVDAVEAHGTGTTLGDPIEAQALLATYGQDRPADRPLLLGSVKSNIGHTQAAAGAAGVIKMVMALRHQMLPPTLHADEPSPHVDWSSGAVRLLTGAVPWTADGHPRRAGVSAFGISGTNAHAIIEEAPSAADDLVGDGGESRPPLLDCGVTAWLMSGRTPGGLAAQATRLAGYLTQRLLEPADVAWSLAGRSVFEHRAVVVGADSGSLVTGVAAVAAGAPAPAVIEGSVPPGGGAGRVVLVFPGQGGQWAGMGRELAACSPVFAARLAECGRALAPYVDWSLDDVLADARALERVDVVQPALWAVMVSLAAVWEAAGVTPDAVVGHSQGEIAAACVAGILSLEDAAAVVALRSRALTALAGRGAMVSIAEPADRVPERLASFGDRLSVAAVNGPAATVVSGEVVALTELAAACEAEGVRARVLPVDYASHSAQVERLRGEILAALDGIRPGQARIPMVSAMTGEWVDGPELDAGYWYASLRAPVEFDRAVRVLAGAGHQVLIEASPHPVLTAAVTQTLDDAGAQAPVVTGTLRRDDGGPARLLACLAEVFVRGVSVNWESVLDRGHQVELPTYAFQRQHYWPGGPGAVVTAGRDGAGSVAEARFWAAVEGGDVARLAQALGVRDGTGLGELVPALASWRRRERAESAAAGWRYRVSWAAVTEPAPAAPRGTWLVIAPEGHAQASEVLGALNGAGARVLAVQVGAGELDRAVLAGQIGRALADPAADEAGPRPVAGVVSLLALDEAPAAGQPELSSGLAGTLGLVQALGDAGIGAPLWVLTRGAVAAGPDESVASPAQASVWGLGLAAGLEHPERWGGLVDVPPVLDERAAGRLRAVLAGCGEDQVAIRETGTFGRRLVRAAAARAGKPWAPRGTVLVTGGTGGVGGHVARWAADRGAGRVVLTSRSGPGAAGVAGLAAGLAGSGTAVEVVACDAAVREQAAGLLARAGGPGPGVSSVFHAAGAGHGCALDDLTADGLAGLLAAKAGGALVLDELTAGLDLDAFVLFSSGAATWGSRLLGGYAAANAFLDGLAGARRGRGLPAASVAWGLWGGGGMGEGAAGEQLERLGVRFMDPRLAARALGQVLDGGETLVTVADVDWARFAPVFTLRRPSPLLAGLPEAAQALAAADRGGAPGAGTALARRLAGLAEAEQGRVLANLVRAEAAAVLGHASADAVEAGRAFRDLGFDSVTAVELRNRLNEATGLRLPSTLVFDHPTALAVTRFLRGELLGVPAAAGPAPALTAAYEEPLAVIGMGCRLPGDVRTPEGLWDLLAAETDAVSGFPADRGWDVLEGARGSGTGRDYARRGGFVYDAGEFDPGFFGISPREALAMDPQQRLLLEVSWEAIERAGLDPSSLRGSSTGVFAGAAFSGYGAGLAEETKDAEGYLLTGTTTSVISGRVAYVLGLEGPAVTVDTACSSSLVALHLACQALRSGECSMALAAGVAVMVTPGAFADFSKQGGLAADGRCKAFAGAADGIGWGEGAGVVLLERLSQARRNGHRVLAVVRGSAVNQDGASNGLTAPNGPSQQRVIRAALASAGLAPDQVDAVEAHGTGTTLGDPIEAQALLATYGQDRDPQRPLWLGSVKSNIGHVQCAAGVAGVIKVVLALQHQMLPATLHVDEPSPHVDWSSGAVRLLTGAVPWTADGHPRRAGVSAFGISGTNAHAILEQAPAADADDSVGDGDPADGGEVPGGGGEGRGLAAGTGAWLVSGRTKDGQRAQAARLRAFVAARPELDPGDVGWSLATTRSVFEHRAVITGSGRDELLAGVSAVAAGAPAAGAVTGSVPPGGAGRVVFVFPGQGGQWAGMGRELAAASPVFAARLAECGRALAPYVDWPLDDVLAGAPGAPGLERADVVQPVLWAVMVSLAAVWEAAGVVPDAVLGHSQGEIAAACVAGILSLQDAAAVVALRSRALTALSGRGAMASVAEPADRVRERLASYGERLSVAAVNGPAATVVSGEPAAVAELAAACQKAGIRARVLPVDYASHSAQVEELRAEILRVLDGITPGPARIPMISAMTGEWAGGPELDAGYWYRSLRAPVEFDRAVRMLAGAGHQVFIEASPHPVLTGAITQTLEDAGLPEPAVTGTLRRDDGGSTRLLTSLAEVFVRGVAVDWAAVLGGGRRVELPTYAFQRQRYWPRPVRVLRALAAAGRDGAGTVAEARFWAAVEGGDVTRLAQALGVQDGTGLGELVPALASWRRRERDESVVAGWRYRVAWVPVAGPGAVPLSGTWLLVVPPDAGGELARWCLAALGARGARVTVCQTGPGDLLDRAVLADRVRAGLAGGPVTAVVSLLAADEGPADGYPAVPRGLAGSLALVQALGDLGIGAPLWMVTAGAVAAGPGDAVTSLAQAQAWGLGRVAGLEHPDRWGGLIDLPPALDERAAERLCAVLAGNGEDQVAVRAGGALGRRLVRAAPPRGHGRGWTARGTVLVTGASGSVGPYLAGWLAGAGAEHVVLVGRRGPHMTTGAGAAIARLAHAGTGVSLVSCDVAERAQVAGLLSWIGTSGPPLTAVVHAAVSGDLMPLDETAVTDLVIALSGKAEGARWLDELTAGMGLDAFVLFSSIAATWGSSEHAAYAAANAYLDALAGHRRARGLPATTVAWGVWDAGDWVRQAEGVPAGPQSVVPTRLRRQGVRFLDPARALGALGQALADDETFLAVADVDWARFAPVFTAARAWRLLDEIPEVRALAAAPPATATVDAGAAGALATMLAGAVPAEQERLTTELVRDHAAAVLGYASGDEVEPGRAFRDLGFDSLTAVELRDRLNAAAGLRLASTVVFDYPSPEALAREIARQLLGIPETVPAGPAPARAMVAGDPVAVVGLGCRFPGGVGDPESLWELLAGGGDAVGGFPADRGWDTARLFDPDPDHAGTSYTARGGFVAGAAEFDPGFFGISPREALAMDPQQRLLLEVCWEALEHAGISPAALRGSSTGVFAGAAPSGYSGYGAGLEGAEGYLVTGNATSVISGRVSYVLGLEGPAVTVDTACSSALVALHLACQALRAGDCSLALAGGVAVMASPEEFVGFSRQRALAADGRCKAFGAGADGMGLAEGAGMVVVERLSDARRLGHRVLAVVAGTAVNQDGASNGLTAPNGPSQQRVIRAALASAGLAPDQVDAVEAHGTGTTLGDPIEAQALLATYGQDRPADRPLLLGSVKSNIGHTQAAAGAAGVIKMVMALRHQMLPPTLHVDEPSPHVDWSSGAVRLLTGPADWRANGRPRRAGVSAFGISGTNAHAIIEEAPAEAGDPDGTEGQGTTEQDGEPLVLAPGTTAWLVSGRIAAALRAQVGRLAAFVAARPELDPGDVGWSLATTRSVFEHRAVITGSGRDELLAGLSAVAAGVPAAGAVSGSVPPSGAGRVVFVFPGQGGQWAGMGRELAACSPVFAARLAECGRALAPYVDWSLDDVLADARALERVDVVQPALWAVMVSLAAVWEAAGVTPDAVVGHSQGEIAAACVAGILSLEDAAAVVALRSRALTALAGRGAMVSIAEPADRVPERLASFGDRLSVAAVNGPAATVVSGEVVALTELAAACEAEGVRARVLPVDYASHSAQVERLRGEILAALDGIRPGQARIPMVSAMTGEWVDGPELDAGYWYASLRAPVEFDRAVRVLAGAGHQVLIEASPHPVLTAAVTQTLDDAGAQAPVVTGTLRRDDGGPARLLACLAEVFVRGVSVNWESVLDRGHQVELPTYAFQRQHYWPGGPGAVVTAGRDGAGSVAEARFWAAVEGGDVARLAQALGVRDGTGLGELVPALASWRRRERAESAAAGWRYRVSWAAVTEPAPAAPRGTWLVIAPEGHAQASEVLGALNGAGARVLAVQVGAGELDRAVLAGQIGRALADPAADEAGPRPVAGVVSLLALDEAPAAGQPELSSGLAGTLGLVQALGDAGIGAPLWVLTRGAVAAGPDESVASPAQASVWGLGLAAGLEHPERWGGLVDVPPVLDERAAGRLRAVLAGCGEDQVAIRETGTFGRRLVRAAAARAGKPWAPRGTVLVTGGTGGVGGHVARWAADRGAGRVVLTSRSGPGAAGVAGLAAGLAGSGTAVEVVACDAAVREQAAGLLARAGGPGPGVSSVFHAAGAGHGCALDDLTADGLAGLLAAKAGGALVLDELTAGLDLDAFVLFSSGAATWGSRLLGGYAAANAFLDGLAGARRGRGLPAASVAWGLWGGGGMGEGAAGEQLERLGVRFMDPRLAARALGQVLDGGETLVTVADVDWARFAPVFTLRRPSPLLAGLPEAAQALAAADRGGAPGAGTALARRLAGLAEAEQGRVLANLVRAEAAAVLGHASADAVEAGRAFRDLGFDSVTAVELRNRLNEATGLRLPSTLVFDHPTSVALAGFLRVEICQDGVADKAPVLAELDQLELTLSAIPEGSDMRTEVTARLRTVLSKWVGAQDDATTEAVAGKLQSASNDEVLSFINKELGVS